MLTYLDESYGNGILLIGTLHLASNSARKYIHRELLKIKKKHNFKNKSGITKEIKYSLLTSYKRLEIAKDVIDIFNKTDKAFFRASVMQYSEIDIKNIRPKLQLDQNIKKAMLYTKSVEQLIKNTYKANNAKEGVLLMDNLVRCKGDNFDRLISKKLLETPNNYIKHFTYVDSKSELNHTIQVCDLLLGSIRCSLIPPRKGKYKKAFSKYVLKTLDLPNFNLKYWKGLRQGLAEIKHHKFAIRVYKVPYRY